MPVVELIARQLTELAAMWPLVLTLLHCRQSDCRQVGGFLTRLGHAKHLGFTEAVTVQAPKT